MTKAVAVRLVRATTLLLALALGQQGSAHAADPPDAEFVLPAPLACTFDLEVEIRGGPQVDKTFTDKNGNVRQIVAGKGSQLTFTNVATGATLTLRPNGSVSRITTSADGLSSTYATTGHNVLILFPSDVPAGPSTTLYVGQVVFTVDNSTGVFTLQRSSGNSTDICAALS